VNPFAVLGIARTGDVTLIKRAYAKAIRANRPDEDPVAFQRCHDAYEACLQHAARASAMASAQADDDDEFDDDDEDGDDAQQEFVVALGNDETPTFDVAAPLPRPMPGDDAPPRVTADDQAAARRARREAAEAERRGFERFMQELVTRARHDHATVLERWLGTLEVFYSLEAKANAPDRILPALCDLEPPLPGEAIEAILRFFHLDGVGQTRPHLLRMLEMLRADAYAAQQFEKVVRFVRNESPIDRLLLDEVLGPRKWLRRVFIAVVPILPTRTWSVYEGLASGGRRYVDQHVDLDAVEFWRRVLARDRFDWRRVLIVLVRLGLLAGGVALLVRDSPEVGPMFAMVAGAGWLAYALVAFVRAQVAAWKQKHPFVDVPTYGMPIAGAVGVALAFAGRWLEFLPFLSFVVFFPTAYYACRAQRDDQARWSAFLALLAGVALGPVAGLAIVGPESPLGLGIAAGVGFTLAVIPLFDQLEAKFTGREPAEIRLEGGRFLWALPALLVAAIVVIGTWFL
jgi:hypothetical protein